MIISGQPAADEGRKWTTEELTSDFEVIGFAVPFVIVRLRQWGTVHGNHVYGLRSATMRL